MRIEQSEYKKKQIALSLVQKNFSRYLVDFSPGEQSKYWGGSQMAYVPVYAFEEIPAIFGDLPDDQLSICAFIGRLTRALTQERRLSLKALPEDVRLKAFEWFQRPSEGKEDPAQLAESAFEQLPEDLRKSAIQVLLRLIQFTQQGAAPQVLNRGDLQAGLSEAADALIKARVLESVAAPSARALQLSEPTILQNWKAYQEWIANDLAFLRWRQSVNAAARSWRISNQRESDLLREDSLHEAKRYLGSRRDELNNDEQEFIKASADRDERQRIVDEFNRSNREALEKEVTLLGQQLALKGETPAKTKWYRSSVFVFGSLAASALVVLVSFGFYFREIENIRELRYEEAKVQASYENSQTAKNLSTIQQLQEQNNMMTARLADTQNQLNKILSMRQPARGNPPRIQSPHQAPQSQLQWCLLQCRTPVGSRAQSPLRAPRSQVKRWLLRHRTLAGMEARPTRHQPRPRASPLRR
jgi:hypothetical protein